MMPCCWAVLTRLDRRCE
uniref:Uncharacterized protein n=1 Tax=Arundo donax TaxID=35708 RepID=A0A0A9C2S6_ARUDO